MAGSMELQKAIRHHTFGKPEEVLGLEQVPVPIPQRGEVRVRLLAAAINPSDRGMENCASYPQSQVVNEGV